MPQGRRPRPQKGAFTYGKHENAPRGPRAQPRGCVRSDRPQYLRHRVYVRDGGKLYYHAAYEGLKGDLLRQNPKVCVLFVDGAEIDEPGLTTHYASAVVRGTARELTDLEEKRAALRLLCARFAPSIPQEQIACIETGPAHTAVWCIDIESVTGKHNTPNA